MNGRMKGRGRTDDQLLDLEILHGVGGGGLLSLENGDKVKPELVSGIELCYSLRICGPFPPCLLGECFAGHGSRTISSLPDDDLLQGTCGLVCAALDS